MSKSTLQSILEAFEKVVKPGIDDGCSPFRIAEVYKGKEEAFVKELGPLFTTLIGDDLRKEIAVRELRFAHDRFFDNLPQLIKSTSPPENIQVIFKVMTGPWLDFFES